MQKLKYVEIIFFIIFFDQSAVLMSTIFTVEILTCKAPNTTLAEFANTVNPDEMAHNELYEQSHLDLQCLPSSL